MCVKSVFVFVLVCCVDSRAQWKLSYNDISDVHPNQISDSTLPTGHSDIPDNPDELLDLNTPPIRPNNVDSWDTHPNDISDPPTPLDYPDILENSETHSSGMLNPTIPDDSEIQPQNSFAMLIPGIPGYESIHHHPHMHPGMHHPIGPRPNYLDDPEPPDRHYPVQHAGLPRKLEVFPLPLENSDHELKFNVSWIPSMGGVARDYSLEVRSVTETIDCQTPMCYEYNIPGEATWWLIPAFSNPVAETCAVRPGCAYTVRLIAHPWDGHTSANLHVELDECVVGVCSCAHSPRLPSPIVSAQTVTIQGQSFANVSWTLPTPSYPQRLPSAKLGKQSYVVSLGKQMVSDAHPAPWFANIISRHIDADGLVSEGDTARFLLLPVSERSVGWSGERNSGRKRPKSVLPDVKLLARVNLVDDRGCVGPAGNATAFDPVVPTTSKLSFGTYAILAALGGAWAMGAVFVLSARVVKRVLKSFRPAPVSAPLEPISRRPAWFPLQFRT